MTTALSTRSATLLDVDLETKTQPSQDRSRATFEGILQAAGQVLAERGVDGFNVNAVVRRAGLTPPAVYRYFPNKYAILKVLSERLMEAQDEIVTAWVARRGERALGETALVEDTYGLLRELVRVTAAFTGSVAVLRAMRAAPVLREVRLKSQEVMAAFRAETLRAAYPHADETRLKAVGWLVIDAGNHVIESLVEGDAPDPEVLLREAAIMLARLQTSLS